LYDLLSVLNVTDGAVFSCWQVLQFMV